MTNQARGRGADGMGGNRSTSHGTCRPGGRPRILAILGENTPTRQNSLIAEETEGQLVFRSPLLQAGRVSRQDKKRWWLKMRLNELEEKGKIEESTLI